MSAPATPDGAYRRQNIPLGIGLMLLAILIFSINDTLGKWLAASYEAPQILLLRSIASILILVPLIGRMGFRRLIDVERPRLQILRAVLASTEVALFYWAVKYLPLADAMTYYLAGPIYVTVLAALFLGERIGWRRWTAVCVGFAGVLIALGPSAESFGWPVLIAFAGSVTYAVFLVITRSLRGTPGIVMAAWQIGASFVFGALATPLVWVTPTDWLDVPLLCLLGVGSLLAIVFVNRSLALAPASVVVPYQYTMILWAIIFGYVIFDDTPTLQTLIGAAIIIAAGLFIYFREARAGAEITPEMPPER